MKKILTVIIQSIITLTCCFMVFCQNPAMAQTIPDENSTGVLQNQMFDTRTLSMANSTIADIYGRPSMGINPALTAFFNNQLFVQFNSNHNWDNNFMQHNLTLPTMFYGPHHITARFGIIHQGFEDLPFTKSSILPEPDLMMYRGELAYAFAINNNFSIGTLQSISYTSAEDEHSWNYFADLGLVYAPDGAVTYGMVIGGIGHETSYEINETGETTLGSQLARQRLEIGVTFLYPIEDTTYLTISFANEKRFAQDGLWYKGGIEITPIPVVNIRLGAMVNFDQSRFFPRLGLGFNASSFRFDYMFAPEKVIGEQFHQIGLTFQF